MNAGLKFCAGTGVLNSLECAVLEVGGSSVAAGPPAMLLCEDRLWTAAVCVREPISLLLRVRMCV